MSDERIRRRFYVENIVVSLGIGLLNYQLFRPDTYLARLGTNLLRIDVAQKMEGVSGQFPKLTMFFRNFASDMLWAYALFFAVACVAKEREAAVVAALFSFGMEGLQQIGILSGTFDWWDVALEWLAIGIGWLVMKRNVKKAQG